MKTYSYMFALGLFLAVNSASAEVSFMLVCESTSAGMSNTAVYRVDLGARKIHSDPLEFDITSLTDTSITAEAPIRTKFGGTKTITINRVTGEYYGENTGQSIRTAPSEGTCKRGEAKF